MKLRMPMLALVLTLLLPPAAARAGEDDRGHDHDRARAALAAGEVKPLGEILRGLESRYLGRVLEVEMEEKGRDHGRRAWIYEVEWLTPQGNVLEFKVDARSGDILRVEGRGADMARKTEGRR